MTTTFGTIPLSAVFLGALVMFGLACLLLHNAFSASILISSAFVVLSIAFHYPKAILVTTLPFGLLAYLIYIRSKKTEK